MCGDVSPAGSRPVDSALRLSELQPLESSPRRAADRNVALNGMDVWVPYQGSARGLSGSDEIGAGSDPPWTTLETEVKLLFNRFGEMLRREYRSIR